MAGITCGVDTPGWASDNANVTNARSLQAVLSTVHTAVSMHISSVGFLCFSASQRHLSEEAKKPQCPRNAF